jgi:hypothetical protein
VSACSVSGDLMSVSSWQQIVDLADGVISDPRQHGAQIEARIETVKLGRSGYSWLRRVCRRSTKLLLLFLCLPLASSLYAVHQNQALQGEIIFLPRRRSLGKRQVASARHLLPRPMRNGTSGLRPLAGASHCRQKRSSEKARPRDGKKIKAVSVMQFKPVRMIDDSAIYSNHA